MVKFELFETVGESITVEGVKSFLNSNKSEDITFDIASLGGDLATGLTIHDLIKSHPKKTIANIVGLTASAGTVIAIACDEVQMSDNALFLIHNGWQEITGNIYDFQKAASDLMKMDAIMVKIYRERTGLKDNKIKDLMKASDWLSPTEAEQLGFVDRVLNSGVKIAASAMIAGAKNKVNKQLLIKLEDKMKNPFKAKAEVMNVLALKDDKSLLINAEEVETGVEVAPLGAMTLEDGEYELADGRKIMVAGGIITEVVEIEGAAPGEEEEKANVDAIVAAVSGIVAEQIAAVEAKFTDQLAARKSSHTPAKGTLVAPNAKVENNDVIGKVNAVADGIRQKLVESRKS
jgi:ATP-dependent protease ClpP protease subunit